jgi:hypothetical protein
MVTGVKELDNCEVKCHHVHDIVRGQTQQYRVLGQTALFLI